jgi:opacity protein-like surface antigen
LLAALFAVLLAALDLIGLLNPALAADYELPTLRGSDTFVPAYPTFFSWQGLYAGGQVGYTSAAADFSRATTPLVAFSLRNTTILQQMTPDQWQVLGNPSTGAGAIGGFVGYNFQWDNAIIGLELNYSHSSLDFAAPSSPLTRRQTVDGLIDDVSIAANGSLHISDFATTRARFGWSVGHFMPYGAVGVAVGRADVALATVVHVVETDPNTPNPNPPPPTFPIPRVVGVFTFPNSTSKNGAYMYGFSGAAGLDFALTQDIFARAEYEYIQWARFFAIAPSMHNFRAGLGVHF